LRRPPTHRPSNYPTIEEIRLLTRQDVAAEISPADACADVLTYTPLLLVHHLLLAPVLPWRLSMYLLIIAVIILLLKIADIAPVANWSWFWVLLPFGLLMFWWEYLSKWIGWDKRTAEKKMAEDVKRQKEIQRQNRGF
jgi:small Trp-rich protein